MKLKTLKDLDEKIVDDWENKVIVWKSAELKSELKAEAIKWYKDGLKSYNWKSSDNLLRWILFFFNITEEDLK